MLDFLQPIWVLQPTSFPERKGPSTFNSKIFKLTKLKSCCMSTNIPNTGLWAEDVFCRPAGEPSSLAASYDIWAGNYENSEGKLSQGEIWNTWKFKFYYDILFQNNKCYKAPCSTVLMEDDSPVSMQNPMLNSLPTSPYSSKPHQEQDEM